MLLFFRNGFVAIELPINAGARAMRKTTLVSIPCEGGQHESVTYPVFLVWPGGAWLIDWIEQCEHTRPARCVQLTRWDMHFLSGRDHKHDEHEFIAYSIWFFVFIELHSRQVSTSVVHYDSHACCGDTTNIDQHRPTSKFNRDYNRRNAK